AGLGRPLPDTAGHAAGPVAEAVRAEMPDTAEPHARPRGLADRLRPPGSSPLPDRARRLRPDVLPVLRGRGLLPAGAGRRLVGVLRAGTSPGSPPAAAHARGAAPASSADPARPDGVRAPALAGVAVPLARGAGVAGRSLAGLASPACRPGRGRAG